MQRKFQRELRETAESLQPSFWMRIFRRFYAKARRKTRAGNFISLAIFRHCENRGMTDPSD